MLRPHTEIKIFMVSKISMILFNYITSHYMFLIGQLRDISKRNVFYGALSLVLQRTRDFGSVIHVERLRGTCNF